jgi:acetylornithine deacetylase/succinyl-diaminopimelate desuccinylase-like protein
VGRHDPEARVVPFLVPGGTDGRFLRPKGVVCYGFCPTLPDVDIRTVHGKNERLPLTSLEFAIRVLWDVVTDVAG